MNVSEFLKNVRRIADSRPTYRTGGDGSDGACDCVGLIIGALGGEFDLHSSNYFARFEMRSLDPLLDESQLHEGTIVYKSRRDQGDLNDRYKNGGRYDNGDLLDYYHVGVVTGIEPLEITHCTSGNGVNGIAYDSKIGNWTHFGDLLKVEMTPGDEEPPAQEASTLAVVHSDDGNAVRMRSAPTTDDGYNTVAKVPNGATVAVLEQAGGWSTVRWNGQRGYMMSMYLRFIGDTQSEPDPAENSYTITLSESTASELLLALRKAGVVW